MKKTIKKLPERKQANLRYVSWKILTQVKVDFDLEEISDSVIMLYNLACKVEPKLK